MSSGLQTSRLLKIHLHSELDVVAARQRARHIAELLGFNNLDQVRIATAVSEMARNAFRYASDGRVEFSLETQPQSTLKIVITDRGNGIDNLQDILDGRYSSKTGMGMGIVGTMRLMDVCDIDSKPGQGVTITLKKNMPTALSLFNKAQLADIAGELTSELTVDAFAEIQRQNQELMQALADLRGRQEELLNLTRELEDTNRGVVALYAEVDEKASHLRRADQMKSRFLSNMSHEFRTPLGSIRALSQLLLDRIDGELGEEQEKQVNFIKKAAEDLSELVNDLLDLAKIEAGKVEIKPTAFSVVELMSALRGMLRPLLISDSVDLSFDVAPQIGDIVADEGKVSQILRNFISNALKFTKRGSIRVTAIYESASNTVRFSVSDSGIGIATDDLQLIFEEFSQIENPMQSRVKGTGLGLPLCRQLANLIGGVVEVKSVLGEGSTFTLAIPYQPVMSDSGVKAVAVAESEDISLRGSVPVLVIEDHAPTRLLYEKYLQNTQYRVFSANNVIEAQMLWQHMRPSAVVLDIMLDGKEAWPWLEGLKNNVDTRDIPVVVVSELAEQHRGLALGADRYYMKPLLREDLINALDQLVRAPA
ncbi:MAG: response regulator [Verrucomicrobiaceae bacterium]|nr:response regulator [Verrucomicrobiaceae bacterium]